MDTAVDIAVEAARGCSCVKGTPPFVGARKEAKNNASAARLHFDVLHCLCDSQCRED